MGKPERVDIWYSLVLALIATLRRLPAWLSDIHITFDEGVFLASTDLARAGLTQYQDFFASQGPLFIPLLQVGRLLSFGDPRGARTIMVISGVVATIAMYFILKKFTSDARAFWLSVPIAVSGTFLLAAGPVQSDGVTLALGLSAIAVVVNSETSRSSLAAGLMLGASVAVKSLHTIPFIVTVALILVLRRKTKDFLMAGLSGVTVVLVLFLISGPSLVWDQYVLFHLAKDNTVDLLTNLANLGGLLVVEDLPFVILLAAITVGHFTLPRTYRGYQPRTVPAVWLMTTVVVFVGFTSIDPGFARNVSFFLPPLMVFMALLDRVPMRLIAILALIATPLQIVRAAELPEASDVENAVVVAMSDLPESRLIVSDDPGLIWAATRLSHRDTIDPSFARLETGYLDARDIEGALADPETCLYVATSGRFESAGIEPPGDYLQSLIPGVFRRSTC